jgi:adenylate cyclase
MLSPKTKRNIKRIVPFGIIWVVFSIVYTLLEKGLLGHLAYYPSTGNPYNFNRTGFVTPITAVVTGILIGILEILYFSKLFIQKSFAKKIIYKTIIYFAIILSFIVIVTVIANPYEMNSTIFDS